MNDTPPPSLSRRDLLKTSGRAAVAGALSSLVIPGAYAGEDNTIQLALIGAGGRGTGAAGDAMNSKNGPTKLVAMADVFEQRIKASYDQLKPKFDSKVDVPDDRKFIGFDGYKKAMD
ncbi:MAG: twin-arginine translocation signal domain-containing protein, partial [Planctomycetaceae bacterium]